MAVHDIAHTEPPRTIRGMRLLPVVLVGLLLVSGCGAGGAPRAGQAGSSQADTSTPVDVGPLFSAGDGRTWTLYVLKNGSQTVGRFVTTCGVEGVSPITSAFVVSAAQASGGPPGLVAVNGRRVSRAARIPSIRRVRGGVGAGLERWLVRISAITGGDSGPAPGVQADLTLIAFRFGRGCEFTLTGAMKLLNP